MNIRLLDQYYTLIMEWLLEDCRLRRQKHCTGCARDNKNIHLIENSKAQQKMSTGTMYWVSTLEGGENLASARFWLCTLLRLRNQSAATDHFCSRPQRLGANIAAYHRKDGFRSPIR